MDKVIHRCNYTQAGAPLPVFTPLRSQQCSATCRGKWLASGVQSLTLSFSDSFEQPAKEERNTPRTHVIATRALVITAEGVTSPVGVMGQCAR